MQNTKILTALLIVVVVAASGVVTFLLYKQMKANALKKPATNYVIEGTNVPTSTIQPTLPAELNQPVAEDASGIDNEIKILDKTANASDTTTLDDSTLRDLNQ